MKVYLVIYEQDGFTTKEDGKVVTSITRVEERYSANSFQEVYKEVNESHGDELESGELTLMTIHEEHPAIFTCKGKTTKTKT